MIEKLISDMLNKHLSKFIESLDAKQLGATLFNSSILLTNMRLKSTMFDDSPLPFALRYGQIGRIFLKIPIWDMFKTPLVIEIEDIVAVVGLKPMAEWSAAQQRQAFLATNQEVLEQFELFIKSQMVLNETERESACSFTDKLLARILDNLQISIKNIYFRFEDQMVKTAGQASSKFSIGIKLKEFSIFTGDSNFKRIKQIAAGQGQGGSQSPLTFKVAKIEGLSLFCDWKDVDAPENGGIDLAELQKPGSEKKSKKATGSAGTPTYFQEIIEKEFSADPSKQIQHKNLIHDLQIELKIEINKDMRNPLMPATLEFPQIKASVVMGRKDEGMSTQVNLYQPQLLRVLRTVEVIGHFNEFKDGVLSDFLTRKLTAAEKTTYIDSYMAWLQLSRGKRDNNKAKGSQIEAKYVAMRQIEDQVHHDVIVVIRKSALGKLKSEDGRQIALDAIEKRIQKQIQKETGLGLFLNESTRRRLEQAVRATFAPEIAAAKQKYDDQDQEISQNMMDLINDFQTQDDDSTSAEGEEHTQDTIDFSKLPQEYVRLEVHFSMPSLTFFLENEFGQVITNLQVQGMNFAFAFANKFTKANMSIDNFGIKDLWAQSDVWPDLLRTVELEKPQQEIEHIQNHGKKSAISVSFEQNKDFITCPFHVVLKIEKSLQIVANLPLINEIVRTMTLALSDQKLDFEYFIQLALGQVNEIKSTAKQYSENVKQGKQEHVNLSIEANIQAPILVIPADIFDLHANMIKLDFGQIAIRSQLIKYNPNTDYKAIEDELELYDKYLLNAQGFSLQIVNAATQEASVIVDDISLAATVKNCVDPLHPKVPALQVDFDLAEKIKAQFDFALAQQLLVMKNHLLLQLKNNIFLMVSLKMSSKRPKDLEILEQQQSKEEEAAREEVARSVEQMRQKAKMQSSQQLQQNQQHPEQEKPTQEIEKKTEDPNSTAERSSSIVINFKISSIELEFDSSSVQDKEYAEKAKEEANILEDDKFERESKSEKEFIGLVFELRNFSSRITLENQAQDITITAGVQQVETLELTKSQMTKRKENRKSDIGSGLPAAIASGDQHYGIFSKVMFWNEKQNQNQTSMQAKKQQKSQESNGGRLLQASGENREEFQLHSQIKVHLRDSELSPSHFKGLLGENDRIKGSKLEEMAIEFDVTMQRTIFVCKITTIQKMLNAVFKVLKLVNADAQDEKEKIFLQKQQVIDALRDRQGGEMEETSSLEQHGTTENLKQKIDQKQQAYGHEKARSKAFSQVINKIYNNLAAQNGKEGPEAIKQFIDGCIDVIEGSDIDLQTRMALETQKVEQAGHAKASNNGINDGTRSFKKLYVITQSYHRIRVQFKAKVEQIELWINDYQGEDGNQIAQTLVFKVGGEFQAKMNEMAKRLRCTKSENLHQNLKLHDFAFNDSVDVVKLVLEEDLEIDANIANISIEQSIVDSWEGALEVLRNSGSANDRIRHTKSDLLLPTSMSANFTSKSQFKLDKLTQITVELKPLSFRADFKDVALTYRFFKSMEEILQFLQDNVIQKQKTMDLDDGANGKSTILPHTLAGGNIKTSHANNESLLQKVSTVVAGGVQDPDGASEGDEGLTSTSSQLQTDGGRKANATAAKTFEQQPGHSQEPTSLSSAAYGTSIDYNFGDLVYQDEPIMFKTESLAIKVAVPQIQIEFCDGQLQPHLQDINPTPAPLLQIQMKKMELRMNQHNINAEFEPTQRSTVATMHETSRKQTTAKQLGGEKPPLLGVHGEMQIESTYFNQISQVFEPFIEPWSLQADVCQAFEDAIFEISLRSEDLLNVNITYGMALSLRNIFVQVQDDITEIDESIKKEKQQHHISRQSMGLNRDTERQNYDNNKNMRKQGGACVECAEHKDSKYAFQNHTGLDIQMYFARQIATKRIAANQQILTQKQTITFKKHLNEKKLPDCPMEFVDSAFFEQPQQNSMSEVATQQDKEENGQRQLEDDPLLIDLEVQGAHRITKIPIENNGVFSYSLLPSKAELQEESKADDFANVLDVVNMVVNIASIGNQRLVSFESQLLFENNINFPVTLQFVFKDRFQKEIDWQASNDIIKVTLHPKEQFRVPLFWYFVDKHLFSVDVYIVQKKDGSQFEDDMTKSNILLFSDITSRFNKVCKKMEAKTHFLKGIEAQIVELNAEQYVSVDINGFKCLPKQTRDENPIQYFVAFSPPLVLSNQSMLPLELFEINVRGKEQQKAKLQSRIPPSMSANVLSLDLRKESLASKSLFKLQFRDNDANMYITKEFQHFGTKESWTESFVRHTNSEAVQQSKQSKGKEEGGNSSASADKEIAVTAGELAPQDGYLDNVLNVFNGPQRIAEPGYCNMEMEISHGHGPSADPSRHQVISESQALKLKIFPKYLIVNKSAVNIYYGDQLVKANSSEVLNLDDRDRNKKTTNIKIRAQIVKATLEQPELPPVDFKESMNIDLNSIGLSGVISLESSGGKDSRSKQQLQFGVKIGLAPVPYNKTTVLTITPRYVIVNKLDYAVQVRMPLQKQKQGLDQEQMALLKVNNEASENQKEIHLSKTSSSTEVKNSIQFRVVNKGIPSSSTAEATDEALWTPPFQIDQLEDFQTQLAIEKGPEQTLKSQRAPEWYEPQQYNNGHQIVRVSISPNDDDTTLFVILSNPAVEEFICKNTTQSPLLLTKYDKQNHTAIGSLQQLAPNSSSAFVWDARDKHAKDVMAQIGKSKAIISLDKISQLSKKKKHLQRKLQKQLLFTIKNENGQAEKYYSTLKTTADGTKVLSISCGSDLVKDTGPQERKRINKQVAIEEEETETKEMALEQAEQLEESKGEISLAQELQEAEAKQTDGFSLKINLRGLGISVIDKRPKELLYISIHKIQLAFGMEVLKDQMHQQEQRRSISNVIVMNEIRSLLDVSIGNFQIDNLINDVMPVIAGAKELYAPNLEAEEDQELDQLFKSIDTGTKKKDDNNNQTAKKTAKDAPFLLLKVSKSERQFQGKVGSIVRFEEIHLAMQEFFVQAETGILESNLSFLSHIVALFYQKVDNQVEPEQYFDEIKDSKRCEICPYVDASPRFLIDESKLKVNKVSFGIIMLGSIKMSLTLQLTKTRRLDRELATTSPAFNGVLYLLAPIVQNFANISDLTIKCNELVILEAFISQDLLIKNMADHYIHQFKRQIFRILGSSDLLGNPANLLSKVGVGFYELARDPLQGMLQGPRGFVAGVGTGMQGVVRGVVGGGFESLSHISGSLYSVVKQTAGDADTRAGKAENFSQGLTQGVKGMGTEVSKGVTGIFSKPFEGAKRSGFKGFTAGIGRGLLGAVATPVAGVLRAGESVAQGISGSANNLSNIGKAEIELLDPRSVRARPARRINHKGKITTYDRNLAIISYYLAKVAKKRLANEQIRFYATIPSIDAVGKISTTKKNILVITGDHFVVLEALNFKNMLKPKLVDDLHRICVRLNKIVKYAVLLSPNMQAGANSSKNKAVAQVDRYYFLSLITVDGTFSSKKYIQGAKGNIQQQQQPQQDTTPLPDHDLAAYGTGSFSRLAMDAIPPKNAMIKYIESQKLASVSGVHQNQSSVLPKHFESGEVTHTIFKNEKLDPDDLEVDWPAIAYAPKHRTVIMSTDFAAFDGAHHILNRLGQLVQNIQATHHVPADTQTKKR